MRHRVPRHSVGGVNVRVQVRISSSLRALVISSSLRALVDRSAERRSLTRSAEMSRLLRIALEKPIPEPPEMRRVRAHIT